MATTEQNHANELLPTGTTLHFLSLINVNYVPLYMVNGSNLGVWTRNANTTTWFETFFYLFGTPDSSGRQSPISQEQLQEHLPDPHEQLCRGILTRVQYKENVKLPIPHTTEIVFYLSQPIADAERFPESLAESGHPFRARFGEYRVHALPLSSDLLKAIRYQALDPPLPEASTDDAVYTSNVSDNETQAQFFVPQFESEQEPSELALKRKRATSIFDEATESRRKTKRHGGESIALAASKHFQRDPASQIGLSTESQSQRPDEQALGGASNRGNRASLEQPRSRSTSTPNIPRPSSKRDPHLPITSDGVAVSLLEERNKETLSRLVMAGMRLYGLSSRSRKSDSGRLSTAAEGRPEQGDDSTPGPTDADTYKLVYHQAYKGAVFAFRQYMRNEFLHLQTERVREVVDRLLAVFCCDPLDKTQPEPTVAGTVGAERNETGFPAGPFRIDTSEAFKQPDIRREGKTEAVEYG